MRCLSLLFLLAACSSSSSPGNMDTSDADSSCNVGGVVNGSFRDSPPLSTRHMFGAVTKVETWTTDTTGTLEQHLAISDGTNELHIRQGGTPVSVVQYVGDDESDGGAPPQGDGSFTQSGSPCVSGSFVATLDRGNLDGMYFGVELGLNPTRP